MTGGTSGWTRRVAFAALAGAALWTVLALFEWRDLFNGPRLSSPWSTYQYGQAMLFTAAPRLAPILAVLALNAAAALIGYWYMVRPIWGRDQCAAPWALLAGVAPGALLIAPVTRLITLAAPNAVAPWLIWAIILAFAGLAIRGLLRSQAAQTALPWGAAAGVGAMIIAALIFQIHMDRAHAVAEGSVWFINELFLSPEHGIGTGGRWPLISQHYDEAAFLYPAIYGFLSPSPSASAELTLIYWITLALMRVSLMALTYIALRGLKLDRLSALLCTTLICAASLALNPASARSLFDSLSPMGYVLHMARFLAPVLPLLIVSAALNAKPPFTWRAYAVATLFALGVAATPVHLALIFPWALALLGLLALNPNAARSQALWAAATLAAVTALIAFSFAYGVQSASPIVRVGAMIAGAAAPAVLMAWLALSARGQGQMERTDLSLLGIALAACAGYGIGVLFLGNFAISRLAPYLEMFWPWANLVVLERLEAYVVVPGFAIEQSPYCEAGFRWVYRSVANHCGSLSMFVRTYGLPFVVIAAVLGWRLLQRRAGFTPPEIRAQGLLLWGVALCLFALPVGFILYDFVAAGRSDAEEHNTLAIWLRSRLVEPWFVSGLLLALAIFLREANAPSRRMAQNVMMAAIALFAFNPLVFAGQWVANVSYLLLMPGG